MNPNEHTGSTEDTAARSVPDDVDIAVVGAGPTGLTIATMLAGYGLRTVVLDRAPPDPGPTP